MENDESSVILQPQISNLSESRNVEPVLPLTLTTNQNRKNNDDDQLFEKYKYFLETVESTTSEQKMKQQLQQSIDLWNELLQMMNTVNKENMRSFQYYSASFFKLYYNAQEMKLFTKDHEYSRQIFFRYFDLLNTQECQQVLLSSPPLASSDAIRQANILLFVTILSSLCGHIIFTESDITEKYDDLLNALRIYVEQKFQSSSVNKAEKDTCEKSLSFIWNFSDRTVTVPSLLRAGFGKSVIEWLNYSNLTSRQRRPLISIVHNLSRHDLGADELNKYAAIETIKRIQQLDDIKQPKVSLITTMILALLSTSEQIKADPTGAEKALDELLQVIINASTNEEFKCQAFHISEPLAVLVKLFVDDATFDYIMNKAQTKPPSNSTSTIRLFSDLLVRFYDLQKEDHHFNRFTFIALFNILWSISFHEQYQAILRQNTQLIQTIEKIARNNDTIVTEQYVPRSMQSIKKSADGILFNLTIELPSVIPVSAAGSEPIKKQKPLVMISYCHANNAFCDQILSLLDEKSDSFDIWVDKRFCQTSDDVWALIAKGIKEAQLIISIVSKEYMESKACRQEVIYAKDRLNKRFLPVYLEKPDVQDWLDIRLAEFKYVRFQNTHLSLDTNKSQEFLSTVIASLSSKTTIQTNTNPQQHTIPPSNEQNSTKNLTCSRPVDSVDRATDRSVLKWTRDDIRRWFQENDIAPEICDLYQFKTGAQMITYAEFLQNDMQKQYERYAVRYSQQNPGKELSEHEFALFVGALKQLINDSGLQQPSIKKIVTDDSQRSSTCILL